jgi:hypothetical protein
VTEIARTNSSPPSRMTDSYGCRWPVMIATGA